MRIEVRVQRFADRPAFQLQWVDPVTGKVKTRSARTTDQRAAEQARADHEYRLNNGLHVEASRITWKGFREAFESEYLPGVRANTQRNYRKALDLAEELLELPALLSGFGTRQASAYVAAMRSLPSPRRGGVTGYKPSTVATHVEFLGAALAWAAEQKLLAEVPRFPAIRLPLTCPQPVPAELYDRLLAAAGGDLRMRACLQCAWLAGLRRNEAYYLQWEHSDEKPYVDQPRRRIVFPAAFVKGGRDQWVPLADELRQDLDAVPAHGPDVFRFSVAAEGLSGLVRLLASKAKVRLTYRSLRRGFGCRYAARVPAQVLQKLMRHASITTTLRYYANVDDAVEAAVHGLNSSTNTRPENSAFSRES